MDDARPRRDDPEVGERALRPAEERVALAVALVLALDVDQERGVGPVLVHLDRVVDHQVGGDERVDRGRVTAHVRDRVAHGGQVHHARDAGEVLEDDPRGEERQLGRARIGVRAPGGQRRGGRRGRPGRSPTPRAGAAFSIRTLTVYGSRSRSGMPRAVRS